MKNSNMAERFLHSHEVVFHKYSYGGISQKCHGNSFFAFTWPCDVTAKSGPLCLDEGGGIFFASNLTEKYHERTGNGRKNKTLKM